MTQPSPSRLDRQMDFLMEIDRLKSVHRATKLADGTRRENSAEHSWHVALFALTLAEHAPQGIDRARVIEMLLLHDLVEIDAGDAPVYGNHDASAVAEAERKAADRIFGLLPEDQGAHFRAIWEEFEAMQTPEARFAKSLDRFAPPNMNIANGGGSWAEYNVDFGTFQANVGMKILQGAPALWEWIAPRAKAVIDRLREGPKP
ncbi:HD domain-containing protein [Tropicibacter naphthalenivorans]|uniref:5'-deoxynucleotidase n=1 Tax=Tropicibacter naphthalenivorans TaxID=441103 RepID=A0A0N7LZ62_9RHOB|nr:HD domain-containing protein [Tropicibacter naphthalenivorans]CUH76777.1 5'-nucleotidase [Tropicibacter naphthalenivorans]SMC63087.1 putative hydrolases of HD superfamily [Tropicibacter naphthalenivorans]